MRHGKKQESMVHTHGKKATNRNCSDVGFINKKFKPASLNMFKEVKENTSKEFKEDRRTMAHQ